MQNKNFSEETARLVDAEVKRIVEEAHTRCRKLLEENADALHRIANALLERETITGDDLDLLMDDKPCRLWKLAETKSILFLKPQLMEIRTLSWKKTMKTKIRKTWLIPARHKKTINRLQPMTRQKTRMGSNSPGIWDEIAGEKPFGLMGILNLTPDSFYDGGRLQSVQCALAHVEKLLNSGTDILDLGAESTRPGSASLPPHMEKNRLLPVF